MSYTASNAINRAQRSLQSHEDMLNKIINKYHKIFPEITKVDIY